MSSDSRHLEGSYFDILPTINEFWGQPSAADVGDESHEGLWTAVGMALTCYESLEEEMASLFSYFVESKSNAAVRAYGTSIGARKDMITAASAIFFERHSVAQEDIEAIDLLIKHHGKAATLRNNIAHGVVRSLHDSDGSPKEWFLISPSYNSRKIDAQSGHSSGTYLKSEVGSSYRYVSKDIRLISGKMTRIAKSAHFLLMRLIQIYHSDTYPDAPRYPQIFQSRRT